MEQKIRLGSAGIIIHENKILLGKRNKEPNFGKWVLPGGKIEFGESIKDAIIREIKEEVGIDVEYKKLVDQGVYEIINNSTSEHRVIIYSYLAPLSFDIVPSSDISEARYFTKDELKNIDLSPVVKQVLGNIGWMF